MQRSNFTSQNFVFNGADSVEYVRLCTQFDTEAIERSCLFDDWFIAHNKYICNKDGSIIISSDESSK